MRTGDIEAEGSVSSRLRSLPSVDVVLSDGSVSMLCDEFGRENVADLVREVLEEARLSIMQGDGDMVSDGGLSVLVKLVGSRAREYWSSSPVRVVNGAGVILHTNLGRAPLSDGAADAAAGAARGYSDLELDLGSGARGSRHSHVSSLLSQVTGADGGIAVNNNAGAALLVLSALAGDGKEVIVSRGEAVEIGGGFRVPDVMRESGARLVEVGTTNRTYARDYESAISDDTAAVLKVHRSNFTLSGFTHDASISEVAEVCSRYGVPLLHDLGSGCLLDTRVFGLAHEPMVQDSLGDGADLVMFSGDKLLGGPQAGVIVGSGDLVDMVSSHPLARAMRIDKMTLAALNFTLRCYLRGDAVSELPIWGMVSASEDSIRLRVEKWFREGLSRVLSVSERDGVLDGVSNDGKLRARVDRGRTAIGGGSAPGQTLPSWRLGVWVSAGVGDLSEWMRGNRPAIVGRIEDGWFYLDARTVLGSEDVHVVDALRRYAGSVAG